MLLPIVVIIFDLKDIFPFFLNDIGISTYCRRIMAMTLFLSPTTPKTTSLAVLVFFISLILVGRRLLGVLVTRYVSKRGVNELIFSRIFLLFFCRHVPLETLGVNLSDA